MKKLRTSLCVLALAFVCILVLPTRAEAAVSGYYEYSVSGNKATIARYTGPGGDVVIPYALGGYLVTAIGDNAFYNCDNLTSVTIPDNITTIGKYAFRICSNLTKVTIGNGVTTIGDEAFYYCRNLTWLTIGNRVATIGANAFGYCEGLGTVTIPGSIVTLGDGAFSFCSGLMGVQISNGITTIGSAAFMHCYNLESVTIPDSVTSIDGSAFQRCNSMKSITLPISVTNIGYCAFYDCWALSKVYYAGTADQWGMITIESGNPKLTEIAVEYNHIHDFSTIPPVTVQPTCLYLGYVEYTCVHGEKYEEYLPSLGHLSEYVPAKDATCEKEGYTAHYQCDRCKEKLVQPTIYPALGHSYDAGKVTRAATCKTTGVRTYTCTTCKKTKAASISKSKKHTYTNNCDTTCNACNVKRTITHSYKTTVTKATFTKNGKTVKKCTVCAKVASTTTIKRVKTVKLSATSYAYNGKAKTPTVTVKDAAGKTLKKNTDYTVTYAKGRKNVGTYKVTVKFKGNYTGTKTLTFKIVPKAASINKLTAKSKAITVKLNRTLQQSTGYEIQYSTTKTFNNAKRAVIKNYKTSSLTLSGLKAKTTYYVRIRTYRTVGNTKYYSNWCAVKSIKTK